jgi:succinate-semialdehyde dehydrogenase/glutarate-semialdehyde dehydrogenase
MNGGQFCSATERIYVTESVSEAFVEAVVEKVRALRQTEDVYDIGPFIFERQLAIVEEQIADAREKGASVLVGGARNEDLRGHWYQPTVLVDVTHDMKVMTEETFGPILPIVVVRDTEEAIAMANDSEYGLAATVWTRDRAQGERIARRLDVGSVIINETSITYGALELPFGGRRSSGVGHVNGASGLRGYCHALPILSDRFGQKEEMVWYPHSPDKVDKIDKAIHWLWKTPLKYLM